MSGVSIALLRSLNPGKHLRWVKIDLQRTVEEQMNRKEDAKYQFIKHILTMMSQVTPTIFDQHHGRR